MVDILSERKSEGREEIEKATRVGIRRIHGTFENGKTKQVTSPSPHLNFEPTTKRLLQKLFIHLFD